MSSYELPAKVAHGNLGCEAHGLVSCSKCCVALSFMLGEEDENKSNVCIREDGARRSSTESLANIIRGESHGQNQNVPSPLAILPSATLSQIRHVRTFGNSMLLEVFEHDDFVDYRLVWLLKLLPALHLDDLTVIGPIDGKIAYDTLQGLIQYGNGWRTLRFISQHWSVLSFSIKADIYGAEPHWRSPKPSTPEEKIIHQRDGAQSGASVTTYSSAGLDVFDTVLTFQPRQISTQEASSPKALATSVVEEDEALSTAIKNGKELLVVVRRGQGADISEEEHWPYTLEHDMRHWAHGITWAEIRPRYMNFGQEDLGDEDDNDNMEENIDVCEGENGEDLFPIPIAELRTRV
ncbi:uncharacterized protein BP5553_08561 [Venustampulla echinocandica]|uniref:Uncharacterized protein n=1 Tax=Venustampulla echinocandica TaxID=2656787 RepID=A0A370TEK1_9HELO|nr:uncharacterized protein BP5553_08561 [Venustampulla echinocandica]RDL33122.1 hypothetical protein BP5553_08561 [Venustampulla echinocandica]